MDAKIVALMDISHTEDFQKALDYLLAEPLQSDDPMRGSFLNLIITYSIWGIETLAKETPTETSTKETLNEKLTSYCYSLERIFQYVLIAAENCIDKRIIGQSSQQSLASL